jgi:hypothetical protein
VFAAPPTGRKKSAMTKTNVWPRLVVAALICLAALATGALRAAPQVAVAHTEGIVHGFLLVRSADGEPIADGDLSQIAHGDRVTVRMILRFKDGSLQDETTVYSQRGRFVLLSDHLIQHGPQFKHPMEVTIDRASGKVTVNYTDDDGKGKTASQKMQLPLDLANGMVPTFLQQVQPNLGKFTAAMVVATPKPRLVKLVITPQGEDSFAVGATSHKAERYDMHIDIGGAAGVMAPLAGKQPADTHVWICQDDAPIFVKLEGPTFAGGPIWQIELASPVWPPAGAKESK